MFSAGNPEKMGWTVVDESKVYKVKDLDLAGYARFATVGPTEAWLGREFDAKVATHRHEHLRHCLEVDGTCAWSYWIANCHCPTATC